jgi:hypothetical protein
MWREFRLGLRGIDDLSRDRGGRIEKTAASYNSSYNRRCYICKSLMGL